jgi:hypothetical protein
VKGHLHRAKIGFEEQGVRRKTGFIRVKESKTTLSIFFFSPLGDTLFPIRKEKPGEAEESEVMSRLSWEFSATFISTSIERVEGSLFERRSL